MKHTQGPWQVVEDMLNERPEIRDADGRLIAIIMRMYPMREATRTANARLIAAAPEMYDLLQDASFELRSAVTAYSSELTDKISGLLKRVEG